MRIILDHYHVMPEFLDVLLQFGSRGMSVFEQNSSSIAVKTSRSTSYSKRIYILDHVLELTYARHNIQPTVRRAKRKDD